MCGGEWLEGFQKVGNAVVLFGVVVCAVGFCYGASEFLYRTCKTTRADYVLFFDVGEVGVSAAEGPDGDVILCLADFCVVADYGVAIGMCIVIDTSAATYFCVVINFCVVIDLCIAIDLCIVIDPCVAIDPSVAIDLCIVIDPCLFIDLCIAIDMCIARDSCAAIDFCIAIDLCIVIDFCSAIYLCVARDPRVAGLAEVVLKLYVAA